jgi:excisionase family DNA binding protein
MLQLEDLKALPDFLSIEKFAELNGVTSRTVERWLQARRLDSVKMAGQVRIPKLEVIRMMSAGYRSRAL